MGWVNSKLPSVKKALNNIPNEYATTGANALGALGYVDCVLELQRQCEEIGLRKPHTTALAFCLFAPEHVNVRRGEGSGRRFLVPQHEATGPLPPSDHPTHIHWGA